MPIQFRDSPNQQHHNVALPVSIFGMRLTVGAGVIQRKGESFSLSDDEIFDFQIKPDRQCALCYLVRLTADNSLRFLVDNFDEGEHPYVFKPGDGYENIRCYVIVDIPAGCSNLNDAVVMVQRTAHVEPSASVPAPPLGGVS
jgi:hypothetical protein